MRIQQFARWGKAIEILLLFAAWSMAVSTASAQMIRLKAAQFDPLASPASQPQSPKLSGGSAAADLFSIKSYPPAVDEQEVRIIQWTGPVPEEGLKAILAQGGRLILPIPDQAWLVSVPVGYQLPANARVTPQSVPRWSSSLALGWKLDPIISEKLKAWSAASSSTETLTAKAEVRNYYIQIAHTGGEFSLVSRIAAVSRSMGEFWTTDNFETWKVQTDGATIEQLARENSIIWIEPAAEKKPMGERDGLVCAGQVDTGASCLNALGASYQSWLDQVGLNGKDIVVHVMDDGLSQGDASNAPGTAHPDILGRIVGIDNATHDAKGDSADGHGHINASIIMGQPIAGGGIKDSAGFLCGQGIAPQAKVFATKIFTNDTTEVHTHEDTSGQSLATLYGRAYTQGNARISSNSWGEPNQLGNYNVDSQAVDLLTRDADRNASGQQQLIFCFAAGNSGSKVGTISAPATAKNVIAVGATENCDRGERDGCRSGPQESDSLRDIVFFSSRGPTDDNRLGPTIVAAGTHVIGAASDDPLYNGTGVCGLDPISEPQEDSRYYPPGQTFYTWSSGTSHSCPQVAGLATLLYEFFKKRLGTPPSPALVKAALVAGAVDIAGGKLNDDQGGIVPHIPNVHSGWGRASLKGLVDDTMQQFALDQNVVLSTEKTSYTQKILVNDSSRPLKIVLAWTDAAGSPLTATQLLNDLDLRVSYGNNTWLGNSFDPATGFSTSGGAADHINNLESVYLRNPSPGIYTVTVFAYNLQANGVTNSGPEQRQDFALFALNGFGVSKTGNVAWAKAKFSCGEAPTLFLTDADLAGTGVQTVTVKDLNNKDTETGTIVHEDPAQPGFFSGNVRVSGDAPPVNEDSVLEVSDGDIIEVSYNDLSDVTGKPRLAKADASMDCTPPVMLNQLIGNLSGNRATLHLETNEPSQVKVELGKSCGHTELTFPDNSLKTSHDLVLTPLQSCTLYFYRITLTDDANNTIVQDNGGNCYAFNTPTLKVNFSDSLEPNPQNGWTNTVSPSTLGRWQSVVYSPAHSPQHAWFVADEATVKDASLITPLMTINPNSRFSFWHTYEFEDVGEGATFDGGVLDISIDGGATWQDLGDSFIQNGYDKKIFTGANNPLSGRQAWGGGKLGLMKQVIVDLANYAGQQARIRFRIGCDEDMAGKGWYVDDVRLEESSTCVGELAQLSFGSDLVTKTSNGIRFTISDSGLAGASPGDFGPFRLTTAAAPTGGATVGPVGLQELSTPGIWEGYLPVASGSLPGHLLIGGILDVIEGQAFRLYYVDSDVLGGTQTVFAEAKLDVTPPVLKRVQVKNARDSAATVHLEASEPVRTVIHYGVAPNHLEFSKNFPSFSASRDMGLNGLTVCSPYYFNLSLTDRAGNAANFDNFGLQFGLLTRTSKTYRETIPQAANGTAAPSLQWTHFSSPAAAYDWRILISYTNAHSSPYVWSVSATPLASEADLVTPAFQIGSDAVLKFWHTYSLEKGFDGGVVEISSNGNYNSWTNLDSEITQGGYNGAIEAEGNPLNGRKAWTGGTLKAMTQVVVDLKRFANTTRKIRFRLGNDPSNAPIGSQWMIDDFELTSNISCGASFPAEPSGFSPIDGTSSINATQPPTLNWANDSLATSYRVYLGTKPNQLSLMRETATNSLNLASSPLLLKAGTRYYWQVVTVNDLGATAGPLNQFRTLPVDRQKFAQQVMGVPTLSAAERQTVDYNNDGQIGVNDLVEGINRQNEQ